MRKIQNTVNPVKQKKLPPLGINIRFGGWLMGLAIVGGLGWACGVSFLTIVGVYLGYKLLRLCLRLTGLLLALVFTVVLICILVIIISLLIF